MLPQYELDIVQRRVHTLHKISGAHGAIWISTRTGVGRLDTHHAGLTNRPDLPKLSFHHTRSRLWGSTVVKSWPFSGYYQPSSVISGIRGNASPFTMTPSASSNCEIVGQMVERHDVSRLLEMGVVKCGTDFGLDGNDACGRNLLPAFYVERFNGSTYTCFAHGAASMGSTYALRMQGSAGTWTAYSSSGTLESQTGFGSATNTFAWVENSGNFYTCADTWHVSASFSGTQFRTGSTWTTWTNPVRYGNCASLTAFGSGGFSANK